MFIRPSFMMGITNACDDDAHSTHGDHNNGPDNTGDRNKPCVHNIRDGHSNHKPDNCLQLLLCDVDIGNHNQMKLQ